MFPNRINAKPQDISKIELGLRGKWVLVVDDNPGDLFLAKLWLERLGCKVITAADGKEAVRECRERVFDFILMDLDLPELDGYEATKAIRSHDIQRATPRTAIVALTGSVSEEASELCEEGDMDDFLAKPICPNDLVVSMVLAFTHAMQPTVFVPNALGKSRRNTVSR